VGSTNVDTLRGTSGNDTFNATGADSGNSGSVTYSDFENLSGLDGDDTFNLTGSVSGTINGGNNDDVIVGGATANTFVVDVDNEGTANGSDFTSVENLTGGIAGDTFTFTADLTGTAAGAAGDDTFNMDGGVVGAVDGGGDSDTATYAAAGSAVTVAVNTFTSIENLEGSAFADTLQGTAGIDTFTVTAENAGNSGTVTFSEFENLDGLGGNDTFNMDAGVTGTVTGGTGSDTVVGAATANTFTVDSPDVGTVNGTDFEEIENITGGAAGDTFTFASSLSGIASGEAGDDTFEVNNGGSANAVDGGADTDEVTYAGSTGPVTVSVVNLTTIETLTGSSAAGADTLQGTTGSDTFTTAATDAGTVNGVDYSSFENLEGLAGTDTFSLNGTQVSGSVDAGDGNDTINVQAGMVVVGGIAGGANTDTLNGDVGDNTWVVNATNAGSLNGQAFTQVENLGGNTGVDTFALSAGLSGAATGGSGNDVFNLNNGGSAGSIDGEAGIDTASYSARTTAVTIAVDTFASIENLVGSGQVDTLLGTNNADTFNINGVDAGSSGTVTFSGFENIEGLDGVDTFNMSGNLTGSIDGGAGSDEIVGGDGAANTFAVNGANAGTVNATGFSSVENLTGGSMGDTFMINAALTGAADGAGGNDTFNLNDGGSAGSVDGGAGTDTATFAARSAAVTVAVDTFTSIENLVGSGFDDTLQGNGNADSFTIVSTDSGIASGVTFSDFESLDGLGGDDTFNLNAGVTGTVDGGAGDDTINGMAGGSAFTVSGGTDEGDVDGSAFVAVENLVGGAGADTFNLSADLTGDAVGGNGNDTFFVNDGGSASQIDGGAGVDTQSYANRTGGVTVGVETLVNMENLVGSGFDDTILLAGDVGNDMSVDGGAGIDTFDVEGVGSTVSGNLSVTNVDTIGIDSDLTVTGATLDMMADSSILQTGGTIIADTMTTTSTGDQTFTDTDLVTVASTITGDGDFDLTNDGEMTAGVTTAGGNIDIMNNGNNLTLNELTACVGSCSTGADDGDITVTTTNGDILGTPSMGNPVVIMDHVSGGSATLTSAFGIGSLETAVRFVDMPTTGEPIELVFSTFAFIDAGDSPVNETENLFNIPTIASIVAAAQAAGREEDEEVDWAAYDEDITVYEINNDGIQLPADQQVDDEFAKLQIDDTVVPIAHNHGRR
jgi:hypothetical protein